MLKGRVHLDSIRRFKVIFFLRGAYWRKRGEGANISRNAGFALYYGMLHKNYHFTLYLLLQLKNIFLIEKN